MIKMVEVCAVNCLFQPLKTVTVLHVMEPSTGLQSCRGHPVVLITAWLAWYQAARPYSSTHVTSILSGMKPFFASSTVSNSDFFFSPRCHQMVTAELAS